jgi:hypothetical protein
MAVTVIRNLADAADALRAAALRTAVKTIGQLADGDGRVYRHPDSAQISYPLTVQGPLGSVPDQGEPISVAIIGAGPAALPRCTNFVRSRTPSRGASMSSSSRPMPRISCSRHGRSIRRSSRRAARAGSRPTTRLRPSTRSARCGLPRLPA